MQEYTPVFIFASAFLSAWVILLLIINRRKDARIRNLEETWTPIRNLLGAPSSERNDYDNDMLMLVCRDFLAQRFRPAGYIMKYYPPEDVAKRMEEVAAYLRPYKNELEELGWTHVSWFIESAWLKEDKNGRKYVSEGGANDWQTAAVLAQTAGALTNFNDPDTIAEDVARAVQAHRDFN